MDQKLKRVINVIDVVIVVVIFMIVGGKYFYPTLKTMSLTFRQQVIAFGRENERQHYQCDQNLMSIPIKGGVVCRTATVPDSVYRRIFDTYPRTSGGKEQIYAFLSDGNMTSADKLLNNIIPINRYEDVVLKDQVNWDEEPNSEVYWRFNYHALRPLTHLFYAFDQTNDKKYLVKVKELVSNFLTTGQKNEDVWTDYHAVAFRTMFLVKTWWQLRNNNLLDADFSQLLLQSIEKHAAFLNDPNHYEQSYNHGLNEAIALFLVPVNFPDLPDSQTWLATATSRLETGLNKIIDNDGVLVENSPYYHFYVIEKLWEIEQYSQHFKVAVSPNLNYKIDKMIQYATYILDPNGDVPLLGASLKRHINLSGIYTDIAAHYPELKYVLSFGKAGRQPADTSLTFKEAGQTILRSAWGSPGTFKDQTHIVFDAGPYRTDHSDLDTLSFTLFSKGQSLLPDSGLYSYQDSGSKRYFHGTKAHNTVTVDGQDQQQGTGYTTPITQGPGYVSVSAAHNLYKGVIHRRSLTLIQNKYLLVVDDLTADAPHLYSQNFHLFKNAAIMIDGTTLTVNDSANNPSAPALTIYQLSPEGLNINTALNQTHPVSGICSEEYEKTYPCYAISYTHPVKTVNQRFVTLIEMGAHDPRAQFAYTNNRVDISDSTLQTSVTLGEKPGSPRKVVISNTTPVTTTINQQIPLLPNTWQAQTATNRQISLVGFQNHTLSFTSNRGQLLPFEIKSPLKLNLSDSNLLLTLKVDSIKNVRNLSLELSNNNWQQSAEIDLKNSYREDYDGEWITTSIGKGASRYTHGPWFIKGGTFNWSNIDGISIILTPKNPSPTTVQITQIATVKAQPEESVMLIFDDGYESILPAAELMHQSGIKGNVAVIADRVTGNKKSYLTLDELKILVDQYGWNILNHTQKHKNALELYYAQNDRSDYEDDIINGMVFLNDNGLNTTPNWFIYPNGATNRWVKDSVGKYYQFARTTINQPEAYPFGDPLGVKTISADASTPTSVILTPVNEIIAAIKDAKTFHQPLFITFHRIESTPTDRRGYSLEDFKKILDYIVANHIKTKSLSEFDAGNGIPERTTLVQPATLPQLTTAVHLRHVYFGMVF